MAQSSARKLPASASLDELVEFFDTHDLGDFWDQMPEVAFDIHLQRRTHLVAVDEDLLAKIAEVARTRRTSSEALVNALLREKLTEAS
jgi:hypothetical protein